MTRLRVDGVPVIEAETPGPCEMCGADKETRPYGPNGEEVCFSCGMKDEAAMKRRFGAFLDGDAHATVDDGEGGCIHGRPAGATCPRCVPLPPVDKEVENG